MTPRSTQPFGTVSSLRPDSRVAPEKCKVGMIQRLPGICSAVASRFFRCSRSSSEPRRSGEAGSAARTRRTARRCRGEDRTRRADGTPPRRTTSAPASPQGAGDAKGLGVARRDDRRQGVRPFEEDLDVTKPGPGEYVHVMEGKRHGIALTIGITYMVRAARRCAHMGGNSMRW